MLLLLKLTLVPTLIVLISLAGARWGARIAGILAGFPIVAGPILLVLTLEQGPGFAGQSAVSTLYGLLALTAYCLVFCWCSLRWRWYVCLPLGWLAFLLVAMTLQRLPLVLPVAAVLSLLSIIVAPRLFPVLSTDHAPQPVPRSELLWRLAAAAALLLSLTALASTLGPAWSGLLTPFPVAGSVLGAFALRAGGAAQAVALLRGMVTGLLGLWLFFVCCAWGLASDGLDATSPGWRWPAVFVIALLLAIAAQAFLLRWRRRG